MKTSKTELPIRIGITIICALVILPFIYVFCRTPSSGRINSLSEIPRYGAILSEFKDINKIEGGIIEYSINTARGYQCGIQVTPVDKEELILFMKINSFDNHFFPEDGRGNMHIAASEKFKVNHESFRMDILYLINERKLIITLIEL